MCLFQCKHIENICFSHLQDHLGSVIYEQDPADNTHIKLKKKDLLCIFTQRKVKDIE